MALFRTQIMTTAASVLAAAGTLADTRVYTARDWPSTPVDFPNIRLAMPHERKDSLGRAQVQFTSVATLAILVRCTSKTSELAEAQLEQLLDQIEQALLPYPDAICLQQFLFAETEVRTNSEGNMPIAEATMMLGCEYYEIFVPSDGVPLREIILTIPVDPVAGDPVINTISSQITLTT